jgi:hypothetical protein
MKCPKNGQTASVHSPDGARKVLRKIITPSWCTSGPKSTFYKSSRDSGRKIGYLSHHDKVHTYDNAIVDTAKKLLPSRHQMYAVALPHMMVKCMSEQCILTLQPRYNSDISRTQCIFTLQPRYNSDISRTQQGIKSNI